MANVTGLQAPTLNSPGLINTPNVSISDAASGFVSTVGSIATQHRASQKAAADLEAASAIGLEVAAGIDESNQALFEDVKGQQLRELEADAAAEGYEVTESDRASIREAQDIASTAAYLKESGQFNTLAEMNLNKRKADFLRRNPHLASEYLTVLDKGTSAATAILSKNEASVDEAREKARTDRDAYITEQVKARGLYRPGAPMWENAQIYEAEVQPILAQQAIAKTRLESAETDAKMRELVAIEQYAPAEVVSTVDTIRQQMYALAPSQRTAFVEQARAAAMGQIATDLAQTPQALERTRTLLNDVYNGLATEATGQGGLQAARSANDLRTELFRAQLRDSESYTALTAVIEDAGPNGLTQILTRPGANRVFESTTQGIESQIVAAHERDVAKQAVYGETRVMGENNGNPLPPPSADIPRNLTPETTQQLLYKKVSAQSDLLLRSAELAQGGQLGIDRKSAVASGAVAFLSDPMMKKNSKMMFDYINSLADERMAYAFAGTRASVEGRQQLKTYSKKLISDLDTQLTSIYGKPSDQLVTVNVDSGMVTVEAVPGSPITPDMEYQLSTGFTSLLRAYAHVGGGVNYEQVQTELFE